MEINRLENITACTAVMGARVFLNDLLEEEVSTLVHVSSSILYPFLYLC